MAMGLKQYPPSVQRVPSGFTAPGAGYWLFSGIVLASLLLFLVLYLALVAASAGLVHLAFTHLLRTFTRGSLLLHALALGASVMLFLFLVKGLFKAHRQDLSYFTEITERDQPELFAFIRRLCREVRAPFPHRIFVSPEVGASVFYDSSLLNLVIPVRKNLHIGLGLVETLTVNEFKAVLAHEFGHFSQSGMAIGSYVYVANRIIADMVLGRDRWDDLLEDWKGSTLQLAWAGWVFSGVVWLLRQLLAGVYLLLNLGRFALGRQMEFHADRVAASVTGSDALVHALARIRFAAEAQEQAVEDLGRAADHGLYSRDLFFHQARAAAFLRAARQDPGLGEPPPLPADPTAQIRVFDPVDEPRASLWDSHPRLWEREQNVKKRYIRSTDDGRSAWALFRDAEILRTAVTAQVYPLHFGDARELSLSSPEEVQALIDGEREAEVFDPRYGGVYDRRILNPGPPVELAAAVTRQPWPRERLALAFDRLYGARLQELARQHREHQKELHFLRAVEYGSIRVRRKQFEFRGERRRLKDVGLLRRRVELELEREAETLAAFDRDVFQSHYQMALAVAPTAARELCDRYVFHLGLQEVLQGLAAQRGRLHFLLDSLSAPGTLSEDEVRQVVAWLREIRDAVQAAVEQGGAFPLPPLKNVAAGQLLEQFLCPGPLVSDHFLETRLPDGDWIRALCRQLEEAYSRSRTLQGKSMAALLALQEGIAGTWRSAAARA